MKGILILKIMWADIAHLCYYIISGKTTRYLVSQDKQVLKKLLLHTTVIKRYHLSKLILRHSWTNIVF